MCVWQNVLEKLGSGNEELQRDCRSAGQASCLVQGLSYVQGCVFLLFPVEVQCACSACFAGAGCGAHLHEVERLAGVAGHSWGEER